MRKQGKQSLLRKKNLRQLLDQLAKRDTESTQLKITQLHDQQKHSHRYNFPLTERYDSRGGNKLIKDKQNVMAASESSIRKEGFRKTTLAPKRSSASKWGTSTERGSLDTQKGQQSMQSTLVLPSISTRLIKKSSFERRREVSEIRKTDSQVSDLAVIEEEAATPVKNLGFGMTFGKLQKQISWGPSSFM